jgi:diguanylate cyclase (GGDEF)-like protein/PAS domain S-box-containing protein
MADALYELTRIANRPAPEIDDIKDACALIAGAAGAAEAYVVRAGDPDFIRIGCDCSPREYEIKQKGYWLCWRDLATNPSVRLGAFDVEERLITGAWPLTRGRGMTHIGAILPGDESNSELMILRGPWPNGIDDEQHRFLTVARTLLSHLVHNVLDTQRRARQREQLELLANVSRAFNDAREAGHAVNDIATALALASGFDWVNLVLYREDMTGVATRGMNVARHSATETAAVFREGRGLVEAGEVALGVELTRERRQLLLPDVFAPGLIDDPEMAPIRDVLPFLQKNFERGHVLSLAILPLAFQDRAIGMVHFSSSTKREFRAEEVEFLAALAAQASTALMGVRLYEALERSQDELRQSEERFRSLVQNSSDLITIVDVEGSIRYASPSVERLMGYQPEEWLGQSVVSLIHPDDLAPAVQSLASVMDQPGVHPATVLRIRHRDGSWRDIETTANNLLDVPSIRGVVMNARDVTERLRTERALRENEERFRSLVQNASDLITLIEADTTIRYQSPSIERVLGYDPALIEGTKLSSLVHIDDVSRTFATLHDAGTNHDGIATAEARMRHADGTWRHIEIIGADQRTNPAIAGFVLNMRDVSERKSLEQQLRHQALHDPLTKLANRTRFADRLDHALLRNARTGHHVAVLFMDLDNFKAVNDSLGHTAGDKLLTGVAERVEKCLRPGDTIARLGGDEFAILIDDVQSIDAPLAVTDRVFEALSEPFELEGKELLVRASMGIALSNDGRESVDADSLLRDADVAMYVAKSRGKGRYEVFEQSMKKSILERLELLADLQRAVERDEFVLQYQPIFLIEGGDLFGLEALVRWNHPRRGQIPPNEFITLAEESGAILDLGRWVLREACRQAQAWRDVQTTNADWTISVNVSVRQLQDTRFVGDVADALRDAGLDPRRLILEITESVMMQDVPSMMERLRELKRIGIRLAIDDFGTGYSSLSYLREFPFDLLKIDKAFIDDLGDVTERKDLTRAIIELGKTLDLELVAEGIENPDQVTKLTSLDCDLGQGFYFAEPLDAADVAHLLTRPSSADAAA